MPKEAIIRQKFIEICKEKGWLYYYPPRTRFHRKDIFGCWDILIIRNNQIIPIQLTTFQNRNARKNKIKQIMKEKEFNIYSEVWSFHKTKKKFIIDYVY